MASVSTRSSNQDPIFGTFLDKLPQNQLPNKTEIYRNYLYRRELEFHKVFQRDGKTIKAVDADTKTKIVNDIVRDLKFVWWDRASIPVRDDRNIYQDIMNILVDASKFVKDISTIRQKGPNEYLKKNGFFKVLDISKCRYVHKN